MSRARPPAAPGASTWRRRTSIRCSRICPSVRLGPPSCISHHQQHMAGLPLVAGVSVLLGCLASCTALPGHLGVEPPAGSTTAFSVPLCVAAGKLPRRDGAVVTTAINFTQLLAGASTEGSVAADSLRVSEAGKHVSFQFDPVTDYDAAHNAAGELVLLLSGETAAGASRNITVSFGSTKVLNPTTPLVNVSTRCDDEGEACLLISTHAQAWKYQLLGGAFSSLLGPDGKNWISYKPSGGSNGSYRGVPNLYNGKDRAGGSCCLHPGDNNSRTAMLRGGRDAPIRVRLESTVANNTAGHAGDWRVWWDITLSTRQSLSKKHLLAQGTGSCTRLHPTARLSLILSTCINPMARNCRFLSGGTKH